jgi:hypothetical protein
MTTSNQAELKTTIEQIDPAKPFEVSTPETAMALFQPVTEELGLTTIQEYKNLTLEVNGFEKVKACRILAKKARCAVTNRQKQLTEGAKVYTNNVNNAAKKIIGLIEPVETYLEGEEEKHQKILAEQEKKEAEKKALVLQDRCDRLAKAGCQAGNLIALGNMTDELFDWHLKDQAEKEAARVEAARVKAEEQQREDAERVARIAAEQAEREEAVRKRQEELRAEAARLAAENERLIKIEPDESVVVKRGGPPFPVVETYSSPAENEEDFEFDLEFESPFPPSKQNDEELIDKLPPSSGNAALETFQEIEQRIYGIPSESSSPTLRPIPAESVQQAEPQQPHARDIEKECFIESNYKCMCCGTGLDETEYGDPKDADICGYCFTDRINEIRARNLSFAPGLNDCGINREIAMMADIEIRLEKAKAENDDKAVQIYQRMLRFLRA